MDGAKIRQRIEEAIRAEDDLDEDSVRDLGFHMTDWLEDLEHFWTFCQNPSQASTDSIYDLLLHFLTHVPNHLAAASKLLMDEPVRDVFGVGAISEEE